MVTKTMSRYILLLVILACAMTSTTATSRQKRFSKPYTVAAMGTYPWIVQLVDKNGLACTGSLISDRHILTAANCLHPSSKTRADIDSLRIVFKNHPANLIKQPLRYIIDPDFSKGSLVDFGTAIIEMDSPAVGISPANTDARVKRPKDLAKMQLMSASYDLDDELHLIHLSWAYSWSKKRLAEEWYSYQRFPRIFQTEYKGCAETTDKGAPFIYKANSQLHIIGVENGYSDLCNRPLNGEKRQFVFATLLHSQLSFAQNHFQLAKCYVDEKTTPYQVNRLTLMTGMKSPNAQHCLHHSLTAHLRSSAPHPRTHRRDQILCRRCH